LVTAIRRDQSPPARYGRCRPGCTARQPAALWLSTIGPIQPFEKSPKIGHQGLSLIAEARRYWHSKLATASALLSISINTAF